MDKYRVRLEGVFVVEANNAADAVSKLMAFVDPEDQGEDREITMEFDSRVYIIGKAFPKCHSCDAVLNSWIESGSVMITYDASGEEIGRDYHSEVSCHCPECDADLTAETVRQIQAGVSTENLQP